MSEVRNVKHLLTIRDLSTAEIERIFAISTDLKCKFLQGLREPLLPGRVMALLFEKPSLRTRVSFESGVVQLGGGAMFLGADVGWGNRESVADFAKVLSQYVDVVVCRTHEHAKVVELAKHCTCAVINGLTDYEHPCQALADLFTLRELLGSVSGRTLAYVGDCNNVARSLALACCRTGMRLAVAAPKAYQFDAEFLALLAHESPGLDLQLGDDPISAVRDAAAVYTDVWASMGQEHEAEERRAVFARYQVNEQLMAAAPAECVFMHCLPAHRGEEVADGVIDSPQSVVVPQAANRMHLQKGILAWLLGARS